MICLLHVFAVHGRHHPDQWISLPADGVVSPGAACARHPDGLVVIAETLLLAFGDQVAV